MTNTVRCWDTLVNKIQDSEPTVGDIQVKSPFQYSALRAKKAPNTHVGLEELLRGGDI